MISHIMYYMFCIIEQNTAERTKIARTSHPKQDVTEIENNLTYLPPGVDWRTKGAITVVRNEGQMGSALPIVAVGKLLWNLYYYSWQ